MPCNELEHDHFLESHLPTGEYGKLKEFPSSLASKSHVGATTKQVVVSFDKPASFLFFQLGHSDQIFETVVM